MSLLDLAKLVDELTAGPVLVMGSWPPSGRDLDILVQRDDPALQRGLIESGFENSGSVWVRFGDCNVEIVDVDAAHEWNLDESEVEALFAESVPLDGMNHLSRPSAHHALLILARRVGERRAELTERRRARIAEAVEANSGAWEEAQRRARAWRGERALANLSSAWSGQQVTRWSALRARSERLDGGTGGFVQAGRSILAGKKRSLRGTLITFSGIDGSGKTTQIDHLVEVLRALGLDAVRVWNRLAINPSLNVIAIPAKKILRPFRRRRSGSAVHLPAGDPSDAARQWRAESDLLTWGWTMVVALWNGLSQRRTTQAHLLRGRVVVCDRYTLDSAVNLRYLYGHGRDFRWQERLIRLLSPSPSMSIFIDVDGAAAHARKPVKYAPEDLERFVGLYRAAYERFDAVRIDGSKSRDQVCSDIARVVWNALD